MYQVLQNPYVRLQVIGQRSLSGRRPQGDVSASYVHVVVVPVVHYLTLLVVRIFDLKFLHQTLDGELDCAIGVPLSHEFVAIERIVRLRIVKAKLMLEARDSSAHTKHKDGSVVLFFDGRGREGASDVSARPGPRTRTVCKGTLHRSGRFLTHFPGLQARTGGPGDPCSGRRFISFPKSFKILHA